MLTVKRFEFNMFGVNTYVVSDPDSRRAIIVDPGMVSPEEEQQLDRYIADNSLTVTNIVHTHLHLDHIFGTYAASAAYGLTPQGSPADFPLGLALREQARMFGLPETIARQPERFSPLQPGDTLTLGNEQIRVIAVPGHSPGGLALYAPASGWVITGDSLFSGSIGRTDLPGGNHSDLVNAVRERLLSLPPLTTVYPGHGPSTTVAAELRSNPYV